MVQVAPHTGDVAWERADEVFFRGDLNAKWLNLTKRIGTSTAIIIATQGMFDFDAQRVDWTSAAYIIEEARMLTSLKFWMGHGEVTIKPGTRVSLLLCPPWGVFITVHAGTVYARGSSIVAAPLDMQVFMELLSDPTYTLWRLGQQLWQDDFDLRDPAVDHAYEGSWHLQTSAQRRAGALYRIPLKDGAGYAWKCWSCIAARRHSNVDYFSMGRVSQVVKVETDSGAGTTNPLYVVY